MRYRAAYT